MNGHFHVEIVGVGLGNPLLLPPPNWPETGQSMALNLQSLEVRNGLVMLGLDERIQLVQHKAPGVQSGFPKLASNSGEFSVSVGISINR